MEKELVLAVVFAIVILLPIALLFILDFFSSGNGLKLIDSRKFRRYYTIYLKSKGNLTPRQRAKIVVFLEDCPWFARYFDID